MQFLKTLLDLSFNRFLVVPIVRAVYCAALVVSALVFAAMIAGGVIGLLEARAEISAALSGYGGPYVSLRNIETKQTAAIVSLVAAPFVTVLLVIGSRVSAEVTIVIFSIADSLKKNGDGS